MWTSSTRARTGRRPFVALVAVLTAATAFVAPADPAGAVAIGGDPPLIAHVPQLVAHSGSPIPIEATVTCDAAAPCDAGLYYRSTSESTAIVGLGDGGWTRVPMIETARTAADGSDAVTFAGTIPAATVTTTGIDYFIEASQSGLLTTMPGIPGNQVAGVDTYWHVQVLNPPIVSHIPPAFARSDSALPLTVDVVCPTSGCSVTMYYRTTSGTVLDEPLLETPDWPHRQMQAVATTAIADGIARTTYNAEIPAEYLNTNGVDYFFHVTDGQTDAWWPGTTWQGYYAPRDGMRTGWHHVHVLETPHIVHVAPIAAAYRANINLEARTNCPATRTCVATLYYRTTQRTVLDPADDFEAAPMTASATTALDAQTNVVTFEGTIPSSVVDTRGVDYFFSVTDGSTTTWWPGTSHVDGYVPVEGLRVGYQHVRVTDPPHIAHVPPGATPALEPLPINATVTCATGQCSATLHYSTDLAVTDVQGSKYTAIPMAPGGAGTTTALGTAQTWTATIPASDVTTRGVAYYIEVDDGYTKAYAPGLDYWGAYVPIDGQRLGALDSAELLPTGVTYGTGAPEENTTVVTFSANTNLQAGLAFPVRVLEPPHPLHAPVTQTVPNQTVKVSATSNCATPSCAATLRWSVGTGSARSATMTGRSTVAGITPLGELFEYTAWIPAADVTEGLQYSIHVHDGYASGTTPTYPVTMTSQVLGAIGDTVYFDRDRNGVKGPNEPGIPGMTLTLVLPGLDARAGTADDVKLRSTVTSPNGEYVFTEVLPGTYGVVVDRLTQPAGTTVVSGSDRKIVTVGLQQFVSTADVGYRYTGTVTGAVWRDLDDAGDRDASEPTISGVGVELVLPGADGQPFTDDDVVHSSATTGADGRYLLEEAPPATARVRTVRSSHPQGTFGIHSSVPVALAAHGQRTGVDLGLANFDLDGDGLTGVEERQLGTDPTKADTDGDGLNDRFESRNEQAPLAPPQPDTDGDGVGDASEDPDADGLSNQAEQDLGTSPMTADFDGDSLTDGAEANQHGTDPTQTDSDGDGVRDDSEIRSGLNPMTSDSDNDGISDADDSYVSKAQHGNVGLSIHGTGDLAGTATVNVLAASAAGQASPTFEIELADGSSFSHADITLPFDKSSFADPAQARMFWFDPELRSWVPAASAQQVDTTAGVVTARVDHFSQYAVFNPSALMLNWTQSVEPCSERRDRFGNLVPVDMMLVLDESGSMTSTDPSGLRRSASKDLIDGTLTGPDDRAGVVEFESSARLNQGLTSDKPALYAAIDQVGQSGGTNIGAGMQVALNELDAAGGEDHIRAIVLMTDGQGTYSPSLTTRASESGTVVFTVGLSASADKTLLQSIAHSTGGQYYQLDTADQLPGAFVTIARHLALLGPDADGDHLTDCQEIEGMNDASGTVFFSEPDDPDSDDDLLTDGEEIGAIRFFDENPVIAALADLYGMDLSDDTYFAVYSDPEKKKSDSDTLDDLAEANEGTDARAVDSDGDGLGDDAEIDRGTDPLDTNTDDDRYNDSRELELAHRGFDPLDPDHVLTGLQWANDYADGAHDRLAEELEGDDVFVDERTTTAWLSGEIAVGVAAGNDELTIRLFEQMMQTSASHGLGLASFVEAYQLLNGDFDEEIVEPVGTDGKDLGPVGDTFSIFAVEFKDMDDRSSVFLPAVLSPTDAVDTVGEFTDTNPIRREEAVGLMSQVAHDQAYEQFGLEHAADEAEELHEHVLVEVWTSAVISQLLDYGFDMPALEKLTSRKGRTNLGRLATVLEDPIHVDQTGPGRFFGTAREGEEYLSVLYPPTQPAADRRLLAPTINRPDDGPCEGKTGVRLADHIEISQTSGRIEHESKVGKVAGAKRILCEILKDKDILNNTNQLEDSRWHFFPSARSDSIGLNSTVLEALRDGGMTITIHTGVPLG
jgi:Mg-chelatase subunit ChlD